MALSIFEQPAALHAPWPVLVLVELCCFMLIANVVRIKVQLRGTSKALRCRHMQGRVFILLLLFIDFLVAFFRDEKLAGTEVYVRFLRVRRRR